MKNIFIIDATLREGSQCPGVKFNIAQSLKISKNLVEIGIDCIEAGHPFIGNEEFTRVEAIVKALPNFPVLSHARAKKEDIDAAKNTGCSWVGIFAGVNECARITRLSGKNLDDVFKMIDNSIRYAKSLGLNVRYTIEDSSRTDIDLLIKTFAIAVNAGANRICYSDSVGCDNTNIIYEKIGRISNEFPNMDIEVHCHNDRGIALANSLAAISAGANWVSSSVNGIGERCGITDTISLIGNLYYDYGRSLPNSGQLKKSSKVVCGITRQILSMQHPIVGANAFKHTAKLHKKAIEKDGNAYTWVNPELFGEKNLINSITLPANHEDLLVKPQIISATELKYHRHGPGSRYVMIDDRFVSDCRNYCMIREVSQVEEQKYSHVDSHRHHVDSIFLFIGNLQQMEGLEVEVMLDGNWFKISSPASVFIPASVEHSYRFISGSGKFINFVLSGNYNESLLEH